MNNRFKDKLAIINQNLFLNFNLATIEKQNEKKGQLDHLIFAIKDNFNYQNYITTGGSRFLENYNSPYNATVVDLLIENGAMPICKTNMDEFGLGGTGLYSGYGDVINPIDPNRITGGSSSGSAVAVKIDACDFALGTDTGDSIRKPASFLGVIGYKPSYGLLSRYGVLPYSPSLDHVGLFAKDLKVIFEVMNVICQNDPKDFTSQKIEIKFTYDKEISYLKIGLINQTWIGVDENVRKAFNDKLNLLNNLNFNNVDYDPKILDLIPLTYKILSYSEAVSCYQNMSTVTFGPQSKQNSFEDSAIEMRSKLFGQELKRRFLIGAYCTGDENYEKLFLKSAKVRTKIIDEFNQILKTNDLVFSLGSSAIAPLVKDVKNNLYQEHYADYFLQVANFGGFPSITIPFIEINGNPIGLNISGKVNDDLKVLLCAKYVLEVLKKEQTNA